jgi:hypothetical protein
MQIIVLLATLAVVSASPSFAAETAHKAGLIDTLLEQADTLRCAVTRDDIPDEMPLSRCDHGADSRAPVRDGSSTAPSR